MPGTGPSPRLRRMQWIAIALVTAAIAHLAQSTPTQYLFTSTDFNSYVRRSIADGAPQRANGRLAASTAPGLGIAPKLDVLGKPVAVYE